jgi:hypothetical protein
MENQLNETEQPLNVKGIILLVGAVFSGLIATIVSGTVTGVITGVIIGLLFAIFFINVLLPYRGSDR